MRKIPCICTIYFVSAYYALHMDFRRPLMTVTPTLDGDVLGALARADVEFSGRELARHVGHGSPEGIRRAADRLVAQGVLSRRVAGAAHLYRLNRHHLAAPWIEGLAGLREELIGRLRESLAGWVESPRVALLFGSVARGQASAASDLDILVIRRRDCDADSDTWRAQLLELQRSATAWTGNDTRVLEYGEDDLSGARIEPVLEDALRDGIELLGSRRTLRMLVNAKARQ
jgi:predicted nucleotidyltransferase